jgi:hypothetical protein
LLRREPGVNRFRTGVERDGQRCFIAQERPIPRILGCGSAAASRNDDIVPGERPG